MAEAAAAARLAGSSAQRGTDAERAFGVLAVLLAGFAMAVELADLPLAADARGVTPGMLLFVGAAAAAGAAERLLAACILILSLSVLLLAALELPASASAGARAACASSA